MALLVIPILLNPKSYMNKIVTRVVVSEPLISLVKPDFMTTSKNLFF